MVKINGICCYFMLSSWNVQFRNYFNVCKLISKDLILSLIFCYLFINSECFFYYCLSMHSVMHVKKNPLVSTWTVFTLNTFIVFWSIQQCIENLENK